MPTVGTTSKPAYVYDAGSDTWIPIGPGEHSHSYIPNTLVDAKGDILTATAADTPAILTVGANDTVLTADSSTATGLKWATPAGSTLDLSQISTGSLSGSAVNLTSLTQDFFLLYITGANYLPSIRLNNNSGSVYSAKTIRLTSSFDTWGGNNRWDLGTTGYSNSSNEWYITIQNGKANGMHTVNYWGFYNSTSAAIGGGYFTNETAITEINIIADGGSFSSGTYTLIGG